MAGRKRGCQTALTPELIERAAKFTRTGVYAVVVADMLMVARSTFRRWLNEGARWSALRERGEVPDRKKEVTPQELLYKRILQVQAEMQALHLGTIGKAAEKYWQAAAWVLERRHPGMYGTDRREVAEMRKRLRDLEARLAALAPEGEPAAQPAAVVPIAAGKRKKSS